MINAGGIYPDARTDEVLVVDDTRTRSHADGRFWSRTTAGLGIAAVVGWYLPIDELFLPTLLIGGLALASGLVAYVDRRRRPTRHVPWGEWGHARGLEQATRPPFAGSGLEVLEPSRERRWQGLHRGRIGRGDTIVEAWIGSTEWNSGDMRHVLLPDIAVAALALAGDNGIDGSPDRATIVAIDLGEDVGRWFPASTLVSFLDPSDAIPTGWSNRKVVARDEQRFESIRLDETRAIRVRGNRDRWHQVFDPELVERLTITPAQWIQRGRWLVLLDTSSGTSHVDAVAVDTLVHVAPDIVARFREVAAAAARDHARAAG